MSEKASEVKETPVAASPEKKEVCEKKTAAVAVEKVEEKEKKDESTDKKEQNGDSKAKNGVEEATTEEKKPVENGDSNDVCSLPQKRKSEAGGDSTDAPTSKPEGVSPEKKAKLEEKVENGEAETAA